MAACSPDEVVKALTFEHKTTWKSPHACDGILCPETMPILTRRLLVNDIQGLRYRLQDTLGTRTQAILDLMWSFSHDVETVKTDAEDRIKGAVAQEILKTRSVAGLAFTLGTRNLCQFCFACAAGCVVALGDGASGDGVVQMRSSWKTAAAAFRAGVRKIGAHTAANSSKATCAAGEPNARGTTDVQGVECEAWLRVYVHPDLGHAERRAQDTDNRYHLQFTTRTALHEKYEKDIVQQGCKPLSYSRFCAIFKRMNARGKRFYSN
jgi:hypothetical protein